MRRAVLSLLVLLILLTPLAARCADNAVPPGPFLGDETYTVHAKGTLADVVRALVIITQHRIRLDGRVLPQTPVSLDLDNATLSVLLMSLCDQAGLVYRITGGLDITLAYGDADVDPRPAADLQDYVVRVIGIMVESSRTLSLSWGASRPHEPDTRDTSLVVTVEITPKTSAAAAYLAGIEERLVATTDTGDTIEHHWPAGDRAWAPLGQWASGGFVGPWHQPVEVRFEFPAPPAGVHKLVRVEGALRLHSDVRATEIQVPVNSVGQVFRRADVAVTAKRWTSAGLSTTVTLEVTAPPLPRAEPDGWRIGWHMSVAAVLLAKDGAREYGSIDDVQLAPGAMTVRYRLGSLWEAPPLQPDRLMVIVTRYDNADKTVPFILENVPVP